MTSRQALGSVFVGVLISGLFLHPPCSVAHPLGNFSISHYTSMRIAQDVIELHYLLDLAEIPTFQELQDTGLVAQSHHPSVQTYLAERTERLQTGLVLEVNGQRLPLVNVAMDILFPPGAGGLPTLKLGFVYRAPLRSPAGGETFTLQYRDTNFPGRAGWQEIIAVAGPGITLQHSSIPTVDRSQALTNYPTDLLHSPPQVLQARVLFVRTPEPPVFVAGTPFSPEAVSPGVENVPHPTERSVMTAFAGETKMPGTPRHIFTELIAMPQLHLGVVCLALAVAMGLGAFHALEPRHGKTVVAAYLVGTRGTGRHALCLGLIVTMTHTAGVYLLGFVTLYASHYVVPERLYPWLGVVSGLLIVGLGGWLLLQRYVGSEPGRAHPHPQASAQTHSHPHAHSHDHGHPHHHHETSAHVSYRQLLALGVTGGMVPCPAALVVLLSALALRRVGFGLLLIVAFSAGLAAVLIAIGLLMVYARRFMARFQADSALMSRWLPLTSAATITIFGLAMVAQALVAAGVLQVRL